MSSSLSGPPTHPPTLTPPPPLSAPPPPPVPPLSLSARQAKLAEEAERYDDMVQNVKALAELNTQLNVEERNLLSVAYKNVVGARRASWRVLTSIESKEKEKGDNDKVHAITEDRDRVEKELEKICQELLEVLEKHLLPEDHTAEGQVFYWKMAGVSSPPFAARHFLRGPPSRPPARPPTRRRTPPRPALTAAPSPSHAALPLRSQTTRRTTGGILPSSRRPRTASPRRRTRSRST